MDVRYKPLWFWSGVVAVAAGFWITFWQPGPFGESPWYAFGPLLLAGGSVLAALQMSVRSVSDLEEKTAPAEIDAWLTLVYVGAIGGWVLSNRHLLMASHWMEADIKQASLRLLMLVVFYVVVSNIMRSRRGKAVLEDERDREIKRRSIAWGRIVLIGCIATLVMMLGLSPAEKLQWASPPGIAVQLWLALLAGWLAQCAATIALYWRDRQ